MANAINHFDHVDWLLVEEYQVIVVVFSSSPLFFPIS